MMKSHIFFNSSNLDLQMYANCTVIPDGQASAGLCPFECNTLIPYLLLNVLGYASGSLKIMPMFLATIR